MGQSQEHKGRRPGAEEVRSARRYTTREVAPTKCQSLGRRHVQSGPNNRYIYPGCRQEPLISKHARSAARVDRLVGHYFYRSVPNELVLSQLAQFVSNVRIREVNKATSIIVHVEGYAIRNVDEINRFVDPRHLALLPVGDTPEYIFAINGVVMADNHKAIMRRLVGRKPFFFCRIYVEAGNKRVEISNWVRWP